MTIYTPTVTPESEERKVAGLTIQFMDGISEQEAKAILENYNLARYKLDFTVDNMPDNYYIIVDEDEVMDIKSEFGNEKDWTGFTSDVKKGDYYIILVSKQAIQNETFLSMLDKYDLQANKFFYCHIIITDRPYKGISEERANELKRELEMNENIFTVYFESIES
jgi:hypothetical protein